jgi:hypothetical protein
MKYVWILVAVVFLVRIDLVLRFLDKTVKKFQSSQVQEINPDDVISKTTIVSVSNDLSLKSSPLKKFLTMLDDFRSTPDLDVKDRALEFLKSNPAMFTEVLNPELEASIYRWRELLVQRNKSTYRFLLDLLLVLKGENLEMIKRFYSISIDNDLIEFLNLYSKSTDTNCMIITYLSDPQTDEEKYNELSERLKALEAYLATDKMAPLTKVFGEKCHLVLKLQVDKMKAVFDASDFAAAPILPENSDVPAEPASPPVAAPEPTVPGASP